MRALVLLASLCACSLNVNYTGTYYQCGSGGTCPPGYECQADVCVPTTPVPPACSTAVTTGGDHGCAVRTDGTVWCWGRNDYGQIGDGTTTDRDTPTQVIGLANAVTVAGGDSFTCAVDSAGAVWCWGHNDHGELGNGTTSDEHMPVQVGGVTAKSITLGSDHACALGTDGSASCWGYNSSGQLGNSSTTDVPTPRAVMGPPATWTALAAGGYSTCGIDTAGNAYCWGANRSGQLGVGDTNQRAVPAQVPMQQAAAIAINGNSDGYGFACAATSGGAVWCWGSNGSGELGRPGPDSQTPVEALTSEHIVALSAGGGQVCGADDHHRLWCWGFNGDGRLADTTTDNRAIPVRSQLDPTNGFSTGNAATCAVDATGAVYCSGDNGRGQLGNGIQTSRGKPQPVPGLANVVALAAGGSHTCALLMDGSVECWGANDNGQIGDGTWIDRVTPTFATTDTVKALAGGGGHTCEISMAGDVQCWGDDYSGQLGNGATQTSSTVPLLVYGLNGQVDQIAAGDGSTCALLGGIVRCWGNVGGLMPSDIGGNIPTGYLGIGSGDAFVCAIRADKQVRCVGNNQYGELGTPCGMSCSNDNDPVPSGLLTNVVDIQARGQATCARTATNDVVCWGDINYNEETPPTMFMSGMAELAMGWDAICGRKADGTAWCFGAAADRGELGDDTYTGHGQPVQVLGLTNVMHVATGGSHACALLADGTVQCWGDDTRGQLGDGIEAFLGPQGTHMTCPQK